MILFSLIASSGLAAKDCPLLPQKSLIDPYKFKDQEISPQFKKVWEKLIHHTSKRQKFKERPHSIYSSTFGDDDPFTLTWLLEIHRSGVFDSDMTATTIECLFETAKTKIEHIFSKKDDPPPHWLSWKPEKERRCIDHAFLALRYVQLNKSLKKINKGVPNPPWLSCYFENRIHEQLSKYEIIDGDFDAAELVFALEGILHLKPSVSGSLLKRVFNVITESQKWNPYWRPVKPIVATPQGSVLFPLSVETASSLLRCCYLIESHHKDPTWFSQNVELFKRYSEWLRSRTMKGQSKKQDGSTIDFTGWHSEHVHLHPGIHVWETSNVILYFQYYTAMLEEHIARMSLGTVNLSIEKPWEDSQKETHSNYWKNERKIIEPLLGLSSEKLKPYDYAGEHIISPREHQTTEDENDKIAYSVLLYGPPGTGKTGFAEEICKALKWPLITVTPSDFIRGGESEVEAKAKMIFEVLEDQFEAVILFDEIDRMILDRASKGYEEQGDIFQFMTPGMLTKLRNLRKKKRVIFIIATNYKERIDPATVRKGRVDAHLLMSLPDPKGRLEIFKNLIIEKMEKVRKNGKKFTKEELEILFSPNIEDELKNAVKATNLHTYVEIKSFFDDIIKKTKLSSTDKSDALVAIIANGINKIDSPSTSLISYKPRFENEDKYNQKPYVEFFVLLYLKLQEKNDYLDEQEKALVKTVINGLLGVDKENLKKSKTFKNKIVKRINDEFPEINELSELIAEGYSASFAKKKRSR